MNVIPYLRVSGKGQIEGDGFVRQLAKITSFINTYKHEYNLFQGDARCEYGVSGTVEGMDRPAFAALMEAIVDGQVVCGAIVVERMDRLARDLMVQEFLLKECRERGIKVFSADTGTMDDMASNDVDPTRVLIRQVLGALAQWEKAMLVAKLGVARKRIRDEKGRCEGELPYGSKPGEGRILQFILEMRSNNMTVGGIARVLNQGGSLTRKGKVWNGDSVYNVLRKHSVKVNVADMQADD